MSKRRTYRTAGLVTGLGICIGTGLVVAERPGRNPGLKVHRESLRDALPLMVVPAGPHYLTTGTGSSRVPVSVPAGFFFEGSSAVDQLVDMAGDAIAKKPARADRFGWIFGGPPAVADASSMRGKWDEPYDTVMVQYQDAVLPTIGSKAIVDLQLDVVRMRSPETVVVASADETREYQVSIELRPYHQERGQDGTMGSMSFTRTGISTGKFSASFTAWARYTFTPLGAGAPIVYDLDQEIPITVHDDDATHFWIPALYDPADAANTVASEEVSTGGPVGPCNCCCCKVDATPGGYHCPWS